MQVLGASRGAAGTTNVSSIRFMEVPAALGICKNTMRGRGVVKEESMSVDDFELSRGGSDPATLCRCALSPAPFAHRMGLRINTSSSAQKYLVGTIYLWLPSTQVRLEFEETGCICGN